MGKFFLRHLTCSKADHHECHYKVGWLINSHMVLNSTQIEIAIQQHGNLIAAIEKAGGEVVTVPYICGALDSVFIKDNAFLFQKGQSTFAFLAELYHQERRTEQSHRRKHFKDIGIKTIELQKDLFFEGGDLVFRSGDEGLFVGYGFRSAPHIGQLISSELKIPTTPLQLVSEFFYHLDTALAVLNDGTAIAYKNAFSSDAWTTLKASPWIQKIIEVSRDEALKFACNLVQIDKKIILGSLAPSLMRALSSAGFCPEYVPLSQFQLAGGSAACLVTEVKNYSREITIPTAASLSTAPNAGVSSSSPNISGSISV